MAQALHFLHTRPLKIVHFDLKSGNVLLSRGGHAQLADVGAHPSWPRDGLAWSVASCSPLWMVSWECWCSGALHPIQMNGSHMPSAVLVLITWHLAVCCAAVSSQAIT